MTHKHVVRLSAEERTHLERLVATGKNSAATLMHARILLKADANHADCNWEDVRITVALDTSISTVLRIRKAFVEEGLDAALYRKRSTRHYQRKLDGAGEARLIAIACSKAPEGRAHWTMQLLADKLIQLKIVDTISDDTVHRTLKKTISSRG